MHIFPYFSKSMRLFQKWKNAKYYTFSLKTCKKVENVNYMYYHSRQKFQSPPCKRVHLIWKIHISLLEYKLYNNTKNKHIFVNMVKMWIWAKKYQKSRLFTPYTRICTKISSIHTQKYYYQYKYITIIHIFPRFLFLHLYLLCNIYHALKCSRFHFFSYALILV